MKRLPAIICLMSVLGFVSARAAEPLTFFEMCDASAAVALRDDLFVVANDEDNWLRIYRLSQPGKPVQPFNLNPLLAGRTKSPELDLEGAARLGQTLFLITSHGRKADGSPAPNRRSLFALTISESQGKYDFKLKGQVYQNLIADLAADPRFAQYQLAEAALRAPESRGALNIEALTDTPQGTLLIGFRNPVPEGRALVVPLLNPGELIAGAKPRFGDPITLDLGGLGLRDMVATASRYYLLAGPTDGKGESRLYSWAGGKEQPRPVINASLTSLNPEAICFEDVDAASEFVVLSDDGGRNINGQDCKDLPEEQRRFRAVRIPR